MEGRRGVLVAIKSTHHFVITNIHTHAKHHTPQFILYVPILHSTM